MIQTVHYSLLFITRHTFLLANSYFPNAESEQIKFLNSMNDTITTMDFSPDKHTVYCGDLNCCLSDRDAGGGNYRKK